jgi:hypothetical protein
MDDKLKFFLSLQIPVFPALIACVIGLAIGYSRPDLGKRATLGVRGFSLLLSSELVATYSNYMMVTGYEHGGIAQVAETVGKLGLLKTSLQLGGLIVLIAAAFHRPATPRLPEGATE